MRFLPKTKYINCPCCDEKIKAPAQGHIIKCHSCKSEIIAKYDSEEQKEQTKILSVFYIGGVITALIKFGIELNLIFSVIVYLSVTTLLIVVFRIPFNSKVNLQEKVEYSFANGFSFPEQQMKKHDELKNWLNRAYEDFIGFSRFVISNDYIVDNVDEESLNFFIQLGEETEILPSALQLKDWQEKYLSKDLEKIELVKEKYHADINQHIEKIKKIVDGVEYFN